MRLEANKYLWDIQQAGRFLLQFTERKTFEDYESDVYLRSAVERQFIIIGEALNRLLKLEPQIALSDIRPIIAFRNVLVHGYDVISNPRVWDALDRNLPTLMAEVDNLLAKQDESSSQDEG